MDGESVAVHPEMTVGELKGVVGGQEDESLAVWVDGGLRLMPEDQRVLEHVDSGARLELHPTPKSKGGLFGGAAVSNPM